jgi:hypothetical protein
MKHIIITICLLLLILNNSQAQSNTVTTGSDSSNASGSISYSLGQIDYIASSSASTFMNQGVQQPFEIVTLSGNEIIDVQISAQVYPNPSVNQLIISIQNYNYENLSYTLFDIRGRQIVGGKIINLETIVNMQPYASAAYILKLADNNKEIKTFKIIKKE